jgi:hypothetical protein
MFKVQYCLEPDAFDQFYLLSGKVTPICEQSPI